MATRPKDSEWLGHEHEVGRAIPLREHEPLDRAHEAHDVADAEGNGELLELVRTGQAAAARAADDGHGEAVAPGGVALQQVGRHPQQHVGGLERLDATDEEQHVALERQAQRGSRLAAGRPA